MPSLLKSPSLNDELYPASKSEGLGVIKFPKLIFGLLTVNVKVVVISVPTDDNAFTTMG